MHSTSRLAAIQPSPHSPHRGACSQRIVRGTSFDATDCSVVTEFRLQGADLAEFLVTCPGRLRSMLPPWLWDEAGHAASVAAFESSRNPHKFKHIADVYSYAFTVAVHAAAARRKKNARISIGLEGAAKSADRRSPEHDVEVRKALALVERLPTHLRDAYVAIELEGATPLEFARAEGIAIQTAYNRISQARRALRAMVSSKKE